MQNFRVKYFLSKLYLIQTLLELSAVFAEPTLLFTEMQ